ncbi:RNA polymerase recycling motor HelD [Lacticaseibacillus hulanensis]|uniref:RNA polymerase recycling motor HelD n=1 Tax=Lacticaseibacillus hulanensis TaxID=2493111 RepID=UPI000FDB621D|nr:RNA polymerase recycling motor HelD [Lacticaseibacillus hulanensis]
MDNSSREFEQQRVDSVIRRIKLRRSEVDRLIDDAHKETQRIERSYGDSTKVNITEIDDRMETNAAVQQQKQMVARAVENEQILTRERTTLYRLEPSPYFGRIDITDDDGDDTLYIGTGTLQNDQGDFLIYDWRAPVAGIYYNGVLGQVSYDTPSGPRSAELKRKRQFRIEDGQIVHMFDTSETVGDAMLQAVLGDQSSEHMQNIVSTIQREQNAIIRDTDSDLLIVQGAAGSGKTSAVLQRIAYLLYHSRSVLNSDQMILFSPNRLYANYIAEVLPSLGEKNMIQTTLNEFLSKRLSGLQVASLFERFERDEQQLPAAAATIRRFKESAEFMQLAAKYAKTHHQLHFIAIELEGSVFFSVNTMMRIYSQLPAAMTTADKLAALRKKLMQRLNTRIRLETHQDWVDDVLAGLSSEQVRHYLSGKVYEESSEELAAVARAVVAEKFAPVYTALYDDYFIDYYAEYLDFLTNCPQSVVAPNVWAAMVAGVSGTIEEHRLDLDDAAPIMYIRDLLSGGGQNHAIKAVFVDEMQDYSPALMCYVHHAFPNANMTLLGDYAQDVFTTSYRNGDATVIDEFEAAIPHKKSRVISLNRAYRSSAPITRFAASLIPDGDQIIPFARDGQLPTLFTVPRADYTQTLVKVARDLAQTNKTVAILTRTARQAEGVTSQLQKHHVKARLLTAADHDLGHGILVLPVYLAKGLEFDAVIAADVSAAAFGQDNSGDILYTLATRALHTLVLIARDEPAPAITAALDGGLIQNAVQTGGLVHD